MRGAARHLLLALLVVVSGARAVPGGAAAHAHAEGGPLACPRCAGAYERAMAHTLRRLPEARFVTQMIMGWTLLADGRHPDELRQVVETAIRWREQHRPGAHSENFNPAFAGIFLVEYNKLHPADANRQAIQGIVDHFATAQERTGGFFKVFEGAEGYPAQDLGMLNGTLLGFFHAARKQGVVLPDGMLERLEACVQGTLTGEGISYGTGNSLGDTTGSRGGFATWGLRYAGREDHAVVRVYRSLLPARIPSLDKGHHVGGMHCLGVVLGCRLLGDAAYGQVTACWLDRLIDRQQEDGGVYVGDDEDAGGERELLGEDDASTAAFALMILLQDPTRLDPAADPEPDWMAMHVPPPAARSLARIPHFLAQGKLADAWTALDRAIARPSTKEEERAEAQALQGAIRGHLDARRSEADAALAAGDARTALRIHEAIAEAMRRHEAAEPSVRALEAIRGDADTLRSLAAMDAFHGAWMKARCDGLPAAWGDLAAVIESYEGTLAARRAKEILGLD